MSTTYVSHDPFARGAYRRTAIHSANTCGYCGAAKKTLFDYTWQGDDNCRLANYGTRPSLRAFCNLSCFRSFNS